MSKKSTQTRNRAPRSASPKRILAIDPGYERCGVAVLTGSGSAPVLTFSTCLRSDATLTFQERLKGILGSLVGVVEEFKPTSIALELLYFNKNQKTAMRVAELRGALLLMSSQLNLPVYEYNPSQVKVAVTGDGAADKRAVKRMVERLVVIPERGMLDDEYDAIALGITHLASQGYPQRAY